MRLDVPLSAPHDVRGYPIEILSDLPGAAAPLLVSVLSPRARRLLVVTDANVAPLYAEDFAAALLAAGFAPSTLVLPAGEADKHMGSVQRVLDAAFAHKLSRTDALIALGGGVVGDITGFAAAIYQRGVDVVQVPTTLLAQVDSSIGGKTGVNHDTGKNLIGAFWSPRAVLASQAVLRTLPPREVRCGLAEAIKHALIAEAPLLVRLLSLAPDLLALEPLATAELVHSCCRIKSAIVAEDPREDPIAGRRAVLNFGHTFGHAYEKLLGYGHWTHGEAVAVGMIWAARLSERLAVAAPGLEAAVHQALAAFGLPHAPEADGMPALASLIEAARGDKKGDAETVRFVLMPRIGEAVVQRLAWAEVQRALAADAPHASGATP